MGVTGGAAPRVTAPVRPAKRNSPKDDRESAREGMVGLLTMPTDSLQRLRLSRPLAVRGERHRQEYQVQRGGASSSRSARGESTPRRTPRPVNSGTRARRTG